MTLVIHDTLSGEKRAFAPRDPGRVTMYVCGPTVYNYAHIGNARPVVVFDTLFRLLRHLYGERAVVYARNITDVDDKINQAAIDRGVPISVITDEYTAAFHGDMDALGALRPTLEPRATAHIEAMLELVGRLIRNNAAYAAEGHVLFDTQAFSDYGALSGRSLDDMIAGARVEVAPYKRHPADFVLWKPSKPGETVWESPWGPGRPGWHLECSAMVEKNLGLPIDIHGGGHDLIFPHHENEIAQSRCADHAPVMAEYWMHNGFLTMDAEKMSKSLGNVLLVHDLVEQVPGEAIRWALLAAHYRAPLDWTGDLLLQSRKSLDRLYGALRRAADVEAPPGGPPSAVIEALCDDLNTPKAVAELFAMAKVLETAGDYAGRAQAKADLLAAGRLMGFLQADPDAWFEGGSDEAFKAKVEALLAARIEARQAKDWATADRIRDELTALKVVVMDGPHGATWRMAE
ncbi:cysteine--tRNA ligase [Phenylobacterium montanum]|uniref:Cysteine--tRNA ligase n=1 Tax=Phenylobacterium montanum TaxID=2823693 RepID=A0A975IUL1_9CAUL|nr:cysteine--tRNA ligase [Caulobacter sp. S6]QUD86356.1 cysteine--tRNA ligase [Caulobacter sp. S6]